MPIMNKKKSMEANMKEGKPEKPSLSMAYNVQKMNKKKKSVSAPSVSPKASDNDEADRHLSIAESILRKRKMMAEGGEVSDLDQEPLDEQDDHYDQLNEEAAESPLYDDSQLSADPMDSNEHGDSQEDDAENTLDMISKIRAKIRKGQ